MSYVRIPETIEERAKRARSELERIKAANALGADIITVYNNQTSNTWDVTNAASNAGQDKAEWLITFTPTEPTGYPPYCEFGFNYRMDSGGNQWDEQQFGYWDDPGTMGSVNFKRFRLVYINTYRDVRISLKFQVKAPMPGGITWTRIV